MSSFIENIRFNDDLKEKLYSASDKVLNYVNERPLWARFWKFHGHINAGDIAPMLSFWRKFRFSFLSFETLKGQVNSWNINYFIYLYSLQMDSIKWMWCWNNSSKTDFTWNYESVFWNRYLCQMGKFYIY